MCKDRRRRNKGQGSTPTTAGPSKCRVSHGRRYMTIKMNRGPLVRYSCIKNNHIVILIRIYLYFDMHLAICMQIISIISNSLSLKIKRSNLVIFNFILQFLIFCCKNGIFLPLKASKCDTSCITLEIDNMN